MEQVELKLKKGHPEIPVRFGCNSNYVLTDCNSQNWRVRFNFDASLNLIKDLELFFLDLGVGRSISFEELTSWVDKKELVDFAKEDKSKGRIHLLKRRLSHPLFIEKIKIGWRDYQKKWFSNVYIFSQDRVL